MTTRTLSLLLLAIFAVACGSTLPAPGSPPPLSVPELKYRVMAQAGIPAFCGPPVVFGGYEDQQAAAQFAAIKADTETYRAILAHAHPAGDESSPDYQVTVWREWRRLQAIGLTPTGSGGSDFRLNTETALVTGHVDAAGRVTAGTSRPARLNCPICLAAGTLIATPNGPVAVTTLRLGDPVWTADRGGRRLPGVVTALGSVAFPLGHDALALVLSDGRSVTASAGHPTADGRTVGMLAPGAELDGARVVSVTPVRLLDGGTYDLLASGPTGDYWADGVLLGSTLGDH
jgi:hypothetical protein